MVLLALLAIALLLWWLRPISPGLRSTAERKTAEDQIIAQFLTLEAREREAEQTVWAREMLAQQCGRIFESLWNSINAATNKWQPVGSFPVGELLLPTFGPPEQLSQGIEVFSPSRERRVLSPPERARWLQAIEQSGWRLVNTEFRHVEFDTNMSGQPAHSRFYFRAHLTNATRSERAILEGNLRVTWAPDSMHPGVTEIDATGLELRSRRGESPFVPVLEETIKPPEKSHFIDPLVLYDLDGDGQSEIILVARNLVYRQQPGGGFKQEPLCKQPVGLLFTGVLADFDGDGAADLLAAKFEGLFMFKGSAQGTFDEPGRLVWAANPRLRYAQALTCGDIDQDGDLDLFLGQYKLPYLLGQMPTPYYDANDGDPAYLLLNDGKGGLSDNTEASGLGRKRWRRTYSASFADLDGDVDLDLLVVSDFAGVDAYRNDGDGRFTEVTGEWVPETIAFGMAHTIADFNADGRLDFLMIGMNSPTVDRLNHLGLWRTGGTEDRTMRTRMTVGNRLYFARPSGGFEAVETGRQLARSGWSWGCSASDFDNDGALDVYIANGHETRRLVSDYEPEFWLHDIYVATSSNNAAANVYFQSRFNKKVGSDQTYGGYEKNRLYLNQHGTRFLEAGHLLGVGLEADSRGVVADDLDGDGLLDLLLTTFEAWPETRQTLRVYRNQLGETGNWIGFRFREEGGGASPVGVTVTVRHAGGSSKRQIITGDSYRSQHANTLHFGLGNVAQVQRVEVQWSNGGKAALQNPEINRYYSLPRVK